MHARVVVACWMFPALIDAWSLGGVLLFWRVFVWVSFFVVCVCIVNVDYVLAHTRAHKILPHPRMYILFCTRSVCCLNSVNEKIVCIFAPAASNEATTAMIDEYDWSAGRL